MAKNDKETVTEKVENRTSTFTLPNRKVKIVPIVRDGWLGKKHEAAFLFQHARNGYTLPKTSMGQYVNPLSREEQEALENHPNLSLKKGDLSIHKTENNFWDKMKTIKLGKEDTLLDLGDPMDYIKYKVLLTNEDHFAPDSDSIRNNPSYKYAIVDLEYQDSKKSKEADVYADAALEYAKIRNDRNALADVCFLLTNRRVSRDTTIEWLKGEVGNIMKNNPARFLNIVQDEDLQLKVLLEKAVTYNAVQKDGTSYRTMNGDLMGVDKTAAILFLKNPANSDHREVIAEMVRRAE